MIEASCSFFEKAGDKSDLMFLRSGSEELRSWTGNGLGQIKAGVILFLAEIEGAK